jgi:hypothetical protein
MDNSVKILQLQMAGRWSAHELGAVLLSITDLYNLRLVLQVVHQDREDLYETWDEMRHWPPFAFTNKRGHRLAMPLLAAAYFPSFSAMDSDQLLNFAQQVYPEETLVVRKISYASPGNIDLVGAGAIAGHLKDLILRIIEMCLQHDQRKLENEGRTLDNDAKRIANARSFVALAQESGCSPSELRKLVGFVNDKQDSIIEVVERGKLIDAKLLELPPEQDPGTENPGRDQ